MYNIWNIRGWLRVVGIYRDYTINGLPSSGMCYPDKEGIRSDIERDLIMSEENSPDPQRLASIEHLCEQRLKGLIHLFIKYPNSKNRQDVIDCMTVYQDAFMNGRERPPV